MIAFLEGELTFIGDGFIWLAVNQVGYEVWMHPQQILRLPPLKSKTFLYIHTLISENDVKLYGFVQQEELQLFRVLLGVSGIGGKAALGIVAALAPDKFVHTILSQDERTLTTIPGIGKKMAGKLIFELKDKLVKTAGVYAPSSRSGAGDEVLEALEALGYERGEVYPLMVKLQEAGEWSERTEDALTLMLKRLSKLK